MRTTHLTLAVAMLFVAILFWNPSPAFGKKYDAGYDEDPDADVIGGLLVAIACDPEESPLETLVREAGLNTPACDPFGVQDEVALFCATTSAPEACQRHLVACALTGVHPENGWDEPPIPAGMGLPYEGVSGDSPHVESGPWGDDPVVAAWMRQATVRACARDATERWVAKRRLDAQLWAFSSWWVDFVVRPWNRVAPWLIAALIAWIIWRRRQNIRAWWWNRRADGRKGPEDGRSGPPH